MEGANVTAEKERTTAPAKKDAPTTTGKNRKACLLNPNSHSIRMVAIFTPYNASQSNNTIRSSILVTAPASATTLVSFFVTFQSYNFLSSGQRVYFNVSRLNGKHTSKTLLLLTPNAPAGHPVRFLPNTGKLYSVFDALEY